MSSDHDASRCLVIRNQYLLLTFRLEAGIVVFLAFSRGDLGQDYAVSVSV